MPRPVEWVGSSWTDLKGFPGPVRNRVGVAIFQAQIGLRHRDAKPMKGFGSGVLEVVARHEGDSFRTAYTVRFKAAIYVLHAFQKKSRRGIGTPKQALDLMRSRLRVAERHYRKHYGGG